MPPAISIVITAYNRREYVAAAIGSVLRQIRRDFELIVWDDGSSDDTVAVAKQAAGGDSARPDRRSDAHGKRVAID